MTTHKSKVRPVWYVGVGLSLAANVALSLFAIGPNRPEGMATGATLPEAVVQAPAPIDAVDEREYVWGRSLNDVAPVAWEYANARQILGMLHEAGFDRTTLASIAYMLAQGELQPQIRAIADAVPLQEWESGGRLQRMSAQQRMEIAALNERARQMASEALAQAGIDDGDDWKYFGNPRYMGIAPDKIAAVAAIDTQYGADLKMAVAGRTLAEARTQLQAERELAIRAVLSDGEYETYQSYYSPLAKRIQGALIGEEISDEKYLETFRAIKSASDHATSGVPGEAEVIRQSLGDRAAAMYAAAHDNSAKPAIKLMREAGVPDAMVVDCFLAFRGRSRADGSRLYRDVASLLSPEQRRVFEQTKLGRALAQSRR